MSESARHRLELWFMRDLRGIDRTRLLELFGIMYTGSNLEEQKAFGRILDQVATSPLSSKDGR